MKKCLYIRGTDQYAGPAWHGNIGQHRQLVRPGHTFTGREGVLGRTPNEHATGWHEPVGWLKPAEALGALQAVVWDGEEMTPGSEEEYLATPDDFPGLAEHYPQVAAAHADD